jgi:hypothetical protein
MILAHAAIFRNLVLAGNGIFNLIDDAGIASSDANWKRKSSSNFPM